MSFCLVFWVNPISIKAVNINFSFGSLLFLRRRFKTGYLAQLYKLISNNDTFEVFSETPVYIRTLLITQKTLTGPFSDYVFINMKTLDETLKQDGHYLSIELNIL